MQDNLLGLPLSVVAEDGRAYILDVWAPSLAQLQETWDRYSKFRVLFSDVTVDDFRHFAAMTLSSGTVVLRVLHDDAEVGLIYFTEIRPLHSSIGHYVFWDRSSGGGRQRVLLTAQRHIMRELGLHRMTMSVPLYAFAALRRLHRMGYRIEGFRTEAILYKGKWGDMIDFGVLLSELTDDAIEQARIPTGDDDGWNKILADRDKLRDKILRPRREDRGAEYTDNDGQRAAEADAGPGAQPRATESATTVAAPETTA